MKKFAFDPICLIVWAWLFVFCGVNVGLSYILAIVIHELGHFLTAKILGYQLNKFSVSAYGVSLSYKNQSFNFVDELKIAIAGPFINFLTAFLVIGFWWIFPTSYFFTKNFVQASLILALFNLLPCYPMDGARIFISASKFFLNDKIAKKITIFINFLLFLIFLCLFFVFCFINFNPSYFLIALFLLFGLFDLKFVSKYEKINIFSKKTKNFSRPTFFLVDLDTNISQMLKKITTSKTIVFQVVLNNGKIINISEKMLINLSITYSLDTKLNEIIHP